MKMPNAESAFIPREKLARYLLSETHPVGRAKAAFFRAVGFDDSTLELLEASLLELADTNEIKESIQTDRGIKYVIDGEISTPSGRKVQIVTIWIIELGEVRPRFVTAYPA